VTTNRQRDAPNVDERPHRPDAVILIQRGGLQPLAQGSRVVRTWASVGQGRLLNRDERRLIAAISATRPHLKHHPSSDQIGMLGRHCRAAACSDPLTESTTAMDR
jgi:hypothetical protein